MRIKLISEHYNKIQYCVVFKDGSVIRRSVEKYTFAIHRYSVRIKELDTKTYWY